MKNLLNITAIVTAFTLFSCGGSDVPQMNTKEGLDKIKSLAAEKFGMDLEVSSFRLNSQQDLNSDLGFITIDYIKEDKVYQRMFMEKTEHTDAVLNDEEVKTDKKRDLERNQGKLKIGDLDTSQIVAKINEALKLIGEDVEEHHIKNYYVNVDSKTNAITSNFEIHFTQKGESARLEGKNIVTNYYEANFKVDSKGIVEMIN